MLPENIVLLNHPFYIKNKFQMLANVQQFLFVQMYVCIALKLDLHFIILLYLPFSWAIKNFIENQKVSVVQYSTYNTTPVLWPSHRLYLITCMQYTEWLTIFRLKPKGLGWPIGQWSNDICLLRCNWTQTPSPSLPLSLTF